MYKTKQKNEQRLKSKICFLDSVCYYQPLLGMLRPAQAPTQSLAGTYRSAGGFINRIKTILVKILIFNRQELLALMKKLADIELDLFNFQTFE